MKKYFEEIIIKSLTEDQAFDDITSDLIINNSDEISFEINTREEIILCGSEAIEICFGILQKSSKFRDTKVNLQILFRDGELVQRTIAKGRGNAKLIFAAERVILNLIQHLSGIATLTNQFVKKLDDRKIAILDTRKTIPGLRHLAKYAVLIGGGKNHRLDLSDMILIKDNHIAAAKGVENAIKQAKKSGKKIEIECDNLNQVKEAILFTPDIIMLDNMNKSQIIEAIKIIDKKCQVEISGGIKLENIANYKNIGVDYISIGAITQQAKSVDIALDII
ncbi:MAG TPA: carboxylating nicotinate-nucleotide diphosphorylase [Rickettsiales bacterium]|nr:carboxylating nicotinate-nucleotide diphosphorylase [Rickettsiales bacterium]